MSGFLWMSIAAGVAGCVLWALHYALRDISYTKLEEIADSNGGRSKIEPILRDDSGYAVAIGFFAALASVLLVVGIVGAFSPVRIDPEAGIVADGSWLVDAVTHVEELESLFDVDFGERDYDTVGGLVVWGFGRVPDRGDALDTHGLHVEVLEADRRRVQRVRVRRSGPAAEAAEAAEVR